MLMPLFISGIIVASGAVLVRNLLYNFPRAEKAIKQTFDFWGKAITCGFCFTYWLSLLYVILFSPLPLTAIVASRITLPYFLTVFISFIAEWLAVGFIAVVFRFGYVALQELVNYEVHQLNAHHQHSHQDDTAERH